MEIDPSREGPAETAAPIELGSWGPVIEDLCAQLAPAPNLPAACHTLLSALVQATQADRGSILVLSLDSGGLRMLAGVGLPAEVMKLPPRPRSISQWVIRERRSVLVDGEVSNQPFDGSAPAHSIQSALSVPVLSHGRAVGVLNLARGRPAPGFAQDDLATVERLAAPVANAIERLQDTQLAHEYLGQLMAAASGPASTLIPSGVSELRSYEIALAHRRGRRFTSDLCDRVSHRNGSHSVLFAQVAGSGPTAQAVAVLAQGFFVAAASPQRSASGLVAHLNTELMPRLGNRPPLAVWTAQLSPSGALAYCNAGVMPPFWVPAEGDSIVRLDRQSPLVGTVPNSPYDEESLQLLPADTVVVVSEGVLSRDPAEAASREERLVETLYSLRRQPLDRLVESLCDTTLEQPGRSAPSEKLTVLALRFTPGQ